MSSENCILLNVLWKWKRSQIAVVHLKTVKIKKVLQWTDLIANQTVEEVTDKPREKSKAAIQNGAEENIHKI